MDDHATLLCADISWSNVHSLSLSLSLSLSPVSMPLPYLDIYMESDKRHEESGSYRRLVFAGSKAINEFPAGLGPNLARQYPISPEGI